MRRNFRKQSRNCFFQLPRVQPSPITTPDLTLIRIAVLGSKEPERLSLQHHQSQHTSHSLVTNPTARHQTTKKRKTHRLIPQRKATRPLIKHPGPSPLDRFLAVILAVTARVRRSYKIDILRDGSGELDRAAVVLVEAPWVVEIDGRSAAFAAVVVVAELGPACEGGGGEEAEGEEGEGGFEGGHGWVLGGWYGVCVEIPRRLMRLLWQNGNGVRGEIVGDRMSCYEYNVSSRRFIYMRCFNTEQE
jgi:hypothetical protein